MIHGALLVWYALTAGSIAFLIYDLTTNTPAMGVMKVAWVLIALYLGPIGLFLYLLSCRQPLPGTHDAFIAAHWKQSIGSLAHCLAGDATGIILAAMVTYRFGLPNGIDLIVEYTAAFLFGWMIFQALFMKSMLGGNYLLALRKTFFAEFVSMNMVMVGMIPTMVLLMYALPESRDPLNPQFWAVMSVATLVGGVTAYPINSWMVRRGVKHGMMSAPQSTMPRAEAPAAVAPAKEAAAPASSMAAMPGMPAMAYAGHGAAQASHGAAHAGHEAALPLAAQMRVLVLTLVALAVAVWLTARIVPIRL